MYDGRGRGCSRVRGSFTCKCELGNPALAPPLIRQKEFILLETLRLLFSLLEKMPGPQGQGHLVCGERSERWRGRGSLRTLTHARRQQRGLVSSLPGASWATREGQLGRGGRVSWEAAAASHLDTAPLRCVCVLAPTVLAGTDSGLWKLTVQLP